MQFLGFRFPAANNLRVASGRKACFALFLLSVFCANVSAQNIFSNPQIFVGASPDHVVMGDFNGDGKLDILTTSVNSATQLPQVNIALGKGDGTFRPAVSAALAVGGKALATGDFNGDSKLDFVTANISNQIQVSLGNGDGTFRAARVAYTNGPPAQIAVGDFNGDGKLDIVVTNTSANNISVFLGNGDGTFQASKNFDAGVLPGGVAVGDFNGDGKLDIAVSSTGYLDDQTYLLVGGVTVSILLGNGDGTFQAKQDFPVGRQSNSIAVGDINGDGKLDLVVAHTDTTSSGSGYNSSGVSVLLGKGDGTFQPTVELSVTQGAFGGSAYGVALRDVNGDNNLDILVSNGSSASYSSGHYTFSVLLGLGNGAFQTHQEFTAGYNAFSLAIGDINGDGKPDVVALTSSPPSYGNGALTLAFGNGDGTFGVAQRTQYLNPEALLVADVNGDGIPDIITPFNFITQSVAVQISKGDGTFLPAVNYALEPMPSQIGKTYTPILADINGDGIPDLLIPYTGSRLINGFAQTVSGFALLPGNGDGSFQAAALHVVGPFPEYTPNSPVFAVMDIDGDGYPDIAETGGRQFGTGGNVYYGLSVLLNNGDGSFQPPAVYAASDAYGPVSLQLQDVTGDGYPDLVIVNTFGALSISRNKGDGTFAYPVAIDTESSPQSVQSVRFGDFNGDGKIDIAIIVSVYDRVYNSIYYLDTLLNVGTGGGIGMQRVTHQLLQPTGRGGASLFLADFNRDGKLDVIDRDNNGLTVQLGNGDGTLQPPVSYPLPGYSSLIAVADLDNDGVLDAVVLASGGVSILRGNGDGTFQSFKPYALGSSATYYAFADFNNDGRLDFLSMDYANASIEFNLPVDNTLAGKVEFEGIAPYAMAQNVAFAFHPLDDSGDFTRTMAVSALGVFSLSGLPGKNYSVLVKGDKYLAARLAADLTGGGASLRVFQSAGDANNDNSVDSSDFGLLIGAFNSASRLPGSGYDTHVDFNSDGFVDSTDFGLLIGNYGESGAF